MIETVEKFNDITKYDIKSYLEDFVQFSNDQQYFIDFYNGDIESLDISYFKKLEDLKVKTRDIQNLFVRYRNQFGSYEFWDLLEVVDNISIKLDTVTNYPKWLRSSVVLSGYKSNIELEYTLKQNQTLESLANEIGYSDPNNDWKELALKNDLKEEDYDEEGGNIFKFSWQNDYRFIINTVVDTITKDTLYGKDIDKKIQFINDDISTLNTNKTLYQTINILMNLLKGDNPEFPDDGVDKSLLTKLNRNFNIYPSLFRQIYNTFSKDDTLKSVAITDIKKEQDAIMMEFKIETRTNEVIEAQL